jgi:hypothetical protein
MKIPSKPQLPNEDYVFGELGVAKKLSSIAHLQE